MWQLVFGDDNTKCIGLYPEFKTSKIQNLSKMRRNTQWHHTTTSRFSSCALCPLSWSYKISLKHGLTVPFQTLIETQQSHLCSCHYTSYVCHYRPSRKLTVIRTLSSSGQRWQSCMRKENTRGWRAGEKRRDAMLTHCIVCVWGRNMVSDRNPRVQSMEGPGERGGCI